MAEIRLDMLEEARRVAAAAREADAPPRLIGGLAIRVHTRGEPPSVLERPYNDTANERVNTMNAGRRAQEVDHDRTGERL